MPFTFDLSDELKATIAVLAKKDKATTEALHKKINQVIACDEKTIDHYKNLRYNLKEYKRVHVAKSFVLLFKVFRDKNHIIFDKFRHHDDAYKR